MINNKISKKVIIIGGGLSGLITGIKLLKKGLDVTIIEKNKQLGGKLVLFENDIYPFQIINFDEIKEIYEELNLSKLYIRPFYLDNVEANYIDFIKNLYNNSIYDNKKIDEINKQINKKSTSKKYYKISIIDYLSDINSKEVSNKLLFILSPNKTMGSLIDFLRNYFYNKIVVLNSLIISDIIDIYINNGGKYLLNKKVESFKFEKKNEASHVVLDDKTLILADYFISTIDPYYTLNSLLKNKFKHILSLYYDDFMNKQIDTRIILLFAINKTFEYNNINVFVNDLRINTSKVNYISFKKCLDEKYILCEVNQTYNDYDYLKILINKSSLYQESKNKIVKDIISIFNNNFLGYKITFKRIITPLDMENNYNTFRGSFGGFIETINNKKMINECKIKNLKNILLCSPLLFFDGDIVSSFKVSNECVKALEEEMKNEKEK